MKPTEHNCNCRTDRRHLALLVSELPAPDRETLVEAGRAWDWRQDESADGVIVIELGDRTRFGSIANVADAVRATVPDSYPQITAAWVEPGPIAEQWQALLKTRPLAAMVPAGESELSGLIRDGRLRSWRQPVLDLANQSIWGEECLIRAEREDRSEVSAGQLVDWARQENLMFLFDRACRETHARSLTGAGDDRHYLINFQPAVIYEPSVCLATTERLLEQTSLRPEQIVFEVVESDRVEDIPRLKRILDHYRAKGFRVALDDFGSAYSGLDLLLQLVPDLVKIDRGIVSQLPGSAIHRSMCHSIVEACHGNGIDTLAEGIETEAELAEVRKLDIRLGQGYLFGRPAPAPELY